MSDESWEEQFKQFLRKTGEDFRRTGEDIRAEAQRLLDAAMDPEKQQRVRDRLTELSLWARKTAQGVAGAVEEAATKAETAFHRAADKMTEATGTQRTPSATAAEEAHPAASAGGAARKPAAKSGKASKARAKPGKSGQKKGAKRKR